MDCKKCKNYEPVEDILDEITEARLKWEKKFYPYVFRPLTQIILPIEKHKALMFRCAELNALNNIPPENKVKFQGLDVYLYTGKEIVFS